LGSKEKYFYRNKLDFSFSSKRWLTREEVESEEHFSARNALGFHIPGAFDKVLDIEECMLQAEPSNSIRNWIKQYAISNNLDFFAIRDQVGLLRNVIIRTTSIGQVMVIMVFFREDNESIKNLLSELLKQFPTINSLLYVINNKGNDTISDLEVKNFSGNDYIEEEMEGLKFRIGPKSFYQTNSIQAYELYIVARNYAQLTGNELVYDLYTGTGTIACFVASKSKKVIGIEYVPEAIEDAWINAKINNISNVDFFAGDMKDILTEDFFREHGKPDVIITDPPRVGMHEEVVQAIIKSGVDKIVYVSCNASTQARDLALLSPFYDVLKSQAVDMFPQTHHVENVVVLKRKEGA